jgi:glycerol-3-phosphate acyltransferase PlsY
MSMPLNCMERAITLYWFPFTIRYVRYSCDTPRYGFNQGLHIIQILCISGFFLNFVRKDKKSSMPGLERYLLIFILGYCIGSLPTAYLLVKRKTSVDIRRAGSGNVGGMNAIQVTNSKFLGAIVIIIDIVKGIAAVVLTALFFGWDFIPMSVAGLCAIIGHNYSVWIKFHGGRGLATAAGAMFILGWVVVLVWTTAWAITYGYSRSIHLSNIIATISLPIVVGMMPNSFSHLFVWKDVSSLSFFLVVLCLSFLLLLRHLEPIREILSSHHNT